MSLWMKAFQHALNAVAAGMGGEDEDDHEPPEEPADATYTAAEAPPRRKRRPVARATAPRTGASPCCTAKRVPGVRSE